MNFTKWLKKNVIYFKLWVSWSARKSEEGKRSSNGEFLKVREKFLLSHERLLLSTNFVTKHTREFCVGSETYLIVFRKTWSAFYLENPNENFLSNGTVQFFPQTKGGDECTPFNRAD